MTASELIAQLRALPGDTVITVAVADPKDTAFSRDVSVDASGRVSGWVASDDEDACAPWARDGESVGGAAAYQPAWQH